MTTAASPIVFISYSHDSEQHKDWVRKLAERLRADGIEVVLDEWEIGPGDDVTAFMEQNLTSSDRVLIICTEQYIEKANTLKGGVGYERMIVTAEVARNLETRKFIPVLRGEPSTALPTFLGPRLYIDFRGDEIARPEYERLLRSLHRAPRYTKPPLGVNPYAEEQRVTPANGDVDKPKNETITQSTDLARAPMEGNQPWAYHWHRDVHQYCGNTLHLILVRFAQGSIFFKDTLLDDVRQSGISDYMSFHLYSHWDLLLRVWADKDTIDALRNRLARNRELHPEKQPEFLTVHNMMHFPEVTPAQNKPSIADVLDDVRLEYLRDVQENGSESKYFDTFRETGLILPDTVRFNPTRIQFYIMVRRLHPLDPGSISRLEKLVREWSKILNRSVYVTSGTSIQLVVKGQAEDYYDIYEFLQAVTLELNAVEVLTETMLVANRDRREAATIDLKKAESYIVEKEFDNLVRQGHLSHRERLQLELLYLEVREKVTEDPHGILIGLIRAKAANAPKEIAPLLSLIFPPFEEKLKRSLPIVLVKEYGADWQTTLDDLKKKERLESKSDIRSFALGDLCKIYKTIILEKRIIDISPLSSEELSSIMDAAPMKRNEFAHEATDLARWDDWFAFCAKFIPVHNRLIGYLESIQKKQ